MKASKIIATVGPSSENILQELQNAGVDIFRLNFSHGDLSWHKKQIQALRNLKKETKIMLDTKGPEIRTGIFKKPILLKKGDRLTLINKEQAQNPDKQMIFCTYLELPRSVKLDDIIMFDNGQFSGMVTSIHQNSIVVNILSDGELGSRRHINLPGIRVKLPTITKEDEKALAFGKEAGVDMVALSFARTSKDIRKARELSGEGVEIAAKIENEEGLRNFKSIAREADGIMIARGDLGVEIPIHHIPVVQRKLLGDIKQIPNTFAIVATGLLRSMKTENRPHRAEVTDIATAVWQGADYVMLSDETAAGKHPVLCVEMLKNTAEFAAKHPPKKS